LEKANEIKRKEERWKKRREEKDTEREDTADCGETRVSRVGERWPSREAHHLRGAPPRRGAGLLQAPVRQGSPASWIGSRLPFM
jgi:hypothetical protein